MKQIIALHLSYVLIFCALNAASQIASTNNTIDKTKTKQVFKHHDEAFGEHDLDAILDDYTEESILITPEGTYTGLKELRSFFEEAFKLFPKDSIEGENIKEVVVKDVVYTIWRAKAPKIRYDYATETFIIQNGKIIRQTFAGHKIE